MRSLKRRYEKHSRECGEIFGRLTLTGASFLKEMYGQRKAMVEATCACGSDVKWYLFESLVKGETKSCGCIRSELASKRMRTHNLSGHPLFQVWVKMRQRCSNENNDSYKDYGGRGISVCEDWDSDFLSFYEWCIENGYEEGRSLDRKNNDGNYHPNNCRMADRGEQNRNTRRNRMYTAFGETKCLFDWGKDSRCVVSVWALRSRIDRDGWDDFEKALTSPAEERKDVSRKMKSAKMLTAFGETKCQSAWLEDERCLVKKDSLVDRLNKGWDAEKAISTPPTRLNKFNSCFK